MTGEELRAKRKALGLSQADMAARLGLSRDYVGQMERGVADVKPRTGLAAERLMEDLDRLRAETGAQSVKLTTSDPLEQMVERALIRAGIPFESDRDGKGRYNLDFYLPEQDVSIEVKRYHTPRISEQMSRATNIIALQGEASVRFFCDQLEKRQARLGSGEAHTARPPPS